MEHNGENEDNIIEKFSCNYDTNNKELAFNCTKEELFLNLAQLTPQPEEASSLNECFEIFLQEYVKSILAVFTTHDNAHIPKKRATFVGTNSICKTTTHLLKRYLGDIKHYLNNTHITHTAMLDAKVKIKQWDKLMKFRM